jgi:cytochrome P450
MDMQTCPVFDANSALYQNLGLLKVAETAARKHGDLVILHTRDDRDTYLVSGERGLDFWRQHAGHLAAEFGDVTSSAMTMRLLLGENTEEASWARIGLPMRRKLAGIAGSLELWFDKALVRATAAFLDGAAAPVTDLRALCRLWAVRATCHPIFGTAVSDHEMADGVLLIEDFYARANMISDISKDADALEEFRKTRAFLDDAVRAGIAAARAGENTILAHLLEAMPDDIHADDRIDHLRPLLFRILFERLGVDGLSLLWALVHLAQDPDLADAIANDAPDANGASGLATAVALETQRLYPELPFLYRTTSRDLDFGAISIPAQATLLFSPFLLHRDERLWDEPTRFDPSRFRNDTGHPDQFLPFGIGLNARRQTDRVSSQIAVALTNICASRSFSLAAAARPGDLLPAFRSILVPRGPISLWWRPRGEARDRVQDEAPSETVLYGESSW